MVNTAAAAGNRQLVRQCVPQKITRNLTRPSNIPYSLPRLVPRSVREHDSLTAVLSLPFAFHSRCCCCGCDGGRLRQSMHSHPLRRVRFPSPSNAVLYSETRFFLNQRTQPTLPPPTIHQTRLRGRI
ncbi:unnamed protein product [Ectocarpus sp. 4 AP-2014]